MGTSLPSQTVKQFLRAAFHEKFVLLETASEKLSPTRAAPLTRLPLDVIISLEVHSDKQGESCHV